MGRFGARERRMGSDVGGIEVLKRFEKSSLRLLQMELPFLGR
jgi:hypothetical protein